MAEAGLSGTGIHAESGEPGGAATLAPGEESSDSEAEHESPQKLIRKVSTSGQIRSKVGERVVVPERGFYPGQTKTVVHGGGGGPVSEKGDSVEPGATGQ